MRSCSCLQEQEHYSHKTGRKTEYHKEIAEEPPKATTGKPEAAYAAIVRLGPEASYQGPSA